MIKPYKYSKINPLRYSPEIIASRKLFRCRHRHNGILHAACYNEAKNIQEKIGCLDIEAGGLDADFDIILSWAIKTVGKDEILYDHITNQDINDGVYDANITSTLVHHLWDYDRVITHYGNRGRFDIPFIRARYLWLKTRKMLDRSIIFPGQGMLWQTDTFTIAKATLKISSRRQNVIANTITGNDIKTKVDRDIWMSIKYGSTKERKKALKYITDHNFRDVEQLEANYLLLRPYCRETRTSI